MPRSGIDVTVRGQDFPTYLKRVYSDRDYDFTNHPFTNMFDPTVGLQRFFTSDNYRKGVAFTNATIMPIPRSIACLRKLQSRPMRPSEKA